MTFKLTEEKWKKNNQNKGRKGKIEFAKEEILEST